MNKFSLALALGTGLILAPALAPSARADAILSQTLPTGNMTTDQFNGLFKPIAADPVLSSNYQLYSTPGDSGKVQSQVFQGTGAAAGLYAYATTISVANAVDSSGHPQFVAGVTNEFDATPLGVDLLKSGSTVYGYLVNGVVGNMTAPAGMTVKNPTELIWNPNTTTNQGAISAQFLDSKTPGSTLGGNESSATFVLLSAQPPTTHALSIEATNPQTTAPIVYTPTPGSVSPIPAPEPTTLLAWAGMGGALLLAGRVRKARAAR
jgi:hypothetical protein